MADDLALLSRVRCVNGTTKRLASRLEVFCHLRASPSSDHLGLVDWSGTINYAVQPQLSTRSGCWVLMAGRCQV